MSCLVSCKVAAPSTPRTKTLPWRLRSLGRVDLRLCLRDTVTLVLRQDTMRDLRSQAHRWWKLRFALVYEVASTSTVATGSSGLAGSATSIPSPCFVTFNWVWAVSASKYAPVTARGSLPRWKVAPGHSNR